MTEINNLTVPSKFSFFERVVPTNKFAWKIAILNAMVFCGIAGIDTFNSHNLQVRFAQLSNEGQHLEMDKAHLMPSPENISSCPWGYKVLFFAFLLVLGNYWLSWSSHWRFLQTWLSRILLPYLFTILVCCSVSWFNFRSPSKKVNLFQMVGFVIVPLLGVASSVIRYYKPHAEKKTKLADVNPKARIAWAEENSNMWRTLAIVSVAGAFTFIAFWVKGCYDWANSVFAEPQLGSVMAVITLQATGIILYVFLGPIYECFRKAEHIRNMLLEIKKEEAKDI